MLTVLLMAAIEKLINLAIASDEITMLGLQPLSGKVLRLTMAKPKLQIDVVFNDDHIRFEPVTSPVFGSIFTTSDSAKTTDTEHTFAKQRTAGIGHTAPDCTISVANPAQFLNLIRAPEGNLPIEGDYKILMHLKQLMAGFDPDLASQLEPIIGTQLSGQLGLVLNHLKGSFKQTAEHAFNDVADWANDIAGNANLDPDMQAQASDLKQQLLKLRADIEREQARLAMIKAEQTALRDKND